MGQAATDLHLALRVAFEQRLIAYRALREAFRELQRSPRTIEGREAYREALAKWRDSKAMTLAIKATIRY
jgi:hypothetical protein